MPRPHHILWKAAEVFFCTASFFLFAVAMLSPDWARQSLSFDNREDVVISRGLFEVSIYDGYGTMVTAVYDLEDEKSDRVDPYCGLATRPSVFVSQLPMLVGNFSIDPRILGNDSSVYKPTRDDDEFEWCHRKQVGQLSLMIGMLPAVLAPLLIFAAVICPRLSCRFAVAAATANVMSAICGFITSCVMGSWIMAAKRAHQLRDIPSEGNWSGGVAFACMVIAALFAAVAVVIVLVDLCTARKACLRNGGSGAETQALLPAYRELDHGNVQKVPLYDA